MGSGEEDNGNVVLVPLSSLVSPNPSSGTLCISVVYSNCERRVFVRWLGTQLLIFIPIYTQTPNELSVSTFPLSTTDTHPHFYHLQNDNQNILIRMDNTTSRSTERSSSRSYRLNLTILGDAPALLFLCAYGRSLCMALGHKQWHCRADGCEGSRHLFDRLSIWVLAVYFLTGRLVFAQLS